MKDRKRIYVAGALSGNQIRYVKNVHRMIGFANIIMRRGFAVFVPGLDLLQALMDGNLEYIDLFENSQSWLKVSDAVFVVPESEDSLGVKQELITAEELGIPVFHKLSELDKIR